MSYCFCQNILGSLARVLSLPAAIGLLVVPMTAQAQFTGSVAGTVQYEHNSNIFDLDSGLGRDANNRHGGDTFVAYTGRFDVSYLWGLQQFYANANASQLNYQRYSDLDHTDYNIDTGLRWILGTVDGRFAVTRSRSMVQFYDFQETTLSVNTSQRELAQIGVKLLSEWRVEGSVYTGTTNQPLPNQPDLQSKDTSGTAALKYLGISGVTMGVDASYASGSFDGASQITNPNYRQTTEGINATYQSIRGRFDGQLGYTRRTSGTNTDSTSGVTGEIRVLDQLTPKTYVQLKLSRVLNTYITNASAEVDTGASFSVNWQATYKLNVGAGYTYTYRQYPGQGNNPIGSNRVDAQQLANLDIAYRPNHWLIIKPYANIQTRRSNFIGGYFNQTIFGVYVTVTSPTKPKGRR